MKPGSSLRLLRRIDTDLSLVLFLEPIIGAKVGLSQLDGRLVNVIKGILSILCGLKAGTFHLRGVIIPKYKIANSTVIQIVDWS